MHNDGTQGASDVWTVYRATDDAQKTADAAVANGGVVQVAPMDVGDIGVMGLVTDAGDAATGLWQPKEFQGFGVLAEPNTPAWFEPHTRDYDASVAFDRDVFRWDAHSMSDAPEFRYTTLGEGGEAAAGIIDATACPRVCPRTGPSPSSPPTPTPAWPA